MSRVKVEHIRHTSSNNDSVTLASDSSVSLKHSGSAKLSTTSTGVSVTGACAATSVSVTGTCTATTFSGSGASLTSLPAANLTGALPAIDGSALTGIATQNPAWFGAQDTHHQISTQTYTDIINLGNQAVNPSVNNGGWDESTGVFTVQSGQAGIYYAFGAYGIDDIQSDDKIRCLISKNGGSNFEAIGETTAQSAGSNKIYQVQHSQIVSLAVGDTLRLKGWHDEGTTEYTEPNLCYFGGFRLFAT